jgi:phospholipase C
VAPYDLTVYGANGYMRAFKGGVEDGISTVLATTAKEDAKAISLTTSIVNAGKAPVTVTVLNTYTAQTLSQLLAAGEALVTTWSLEALYGWYDLVVTSAEDASFQQRLSGHVETGKDSASDPAIGASKA